MEWVDYNMINANKIVGTHDIVFVTLDTLRLDVAVDAMKSGLTPNLQSVLPEASSHFWQLYVRGSSSFLCWFSSNPGGSWSTSTLVRGQIFGKRNDH
jgi:hypothetical protein